MIYKYLRVGGMDGSKWGKELIYVYKDRSPFVSLSSALTRAVRNIGSHIVEVKNYKLGVTSGMGQS